MNSLRCICLVRRAIILIGGFAVGISSLLYCAELRKPAVPPKLVLVIVVDQMRNDYLDRFADLYGNGGLKMLADSGARFTECRYGHIPTTTGPGHSIILSGIMPSVSGIISNSWYDVSLRKRVHCVEDASVHAVGADSSSSEGKMSPRNFDGTTVGDALLRGSPASKVLGIALKERAAILLAGKKPSGAFWFDAASGEWITSTYYLRSLPAWAAEFNAHHVPETLALETWNELLPPSAYERAGKDNAAGEEPLPGESSPVFPHAVGAHSGNRFDALLATPFGNDLSIRFARAAIEGEQLGQRGVTDLLALSFSSPDYCGHLFGPDSHEIEDMYLRLDRQLAQFFTFLDSAVGLQSTTIILTADHGVCPLPEHDTTRHGVRIDPRNLVRAVKEEIGQRFNYDEAKEKLMITFSDGQFYLDKDLIRQKGIDEAAFEEAVGEAAMGEKDVAAYYTRSKILELLRSPESAGPYLRRILMGFSVRLSGDVVLVPREYCFFAGGKSGTTHGTGFDYDTHVPLLMWGDGIRPGIYRGSCEPNDIAPTLAEMLSLRPPDHCAGKSLSRYHTLLQPGKTE